MSPVRPILAAALLTALGAVAPALAQTSSPTRTIAIPYVEVKPGSPDFPSTWTLYPRPKTATLPLKAYVGNVRESSGALLTFTMLSAPEECTVNQCELKILRNGKVIFDDYVCSEASVHRISADGRYFMACDRSIPIPP